jgi:transposase-like protein
MSKNLFSAKRFHDEEAARKWFEGARWPNGPHCPTCGTVEPYETKKAGRYRCKAKECRRDFTVMTGTVMERSHAKLTQWAAGFALAAASKKGFSAHQLHRHLGCQYNTAWFMFHRVREAMRRGNLDLPPMGGDGKIVEADETYIGKVDNPQPSPNRKGRPFIKKHGVGAVGKRAIVALVERGGNVRSFNVKRADMPTVAAIVSENIARESRLHTDESPLYPRVGATFAAHETVKHSAKEYARGDVHTNTVEGVFSIFKRGMRGVYQHCAEKHLHRYLAEFDLRYNHREALGWTDEARTVEAVRGGVGKRLTYHQPNQSGL